MKYDVAVLGAGPGGYVAAIRASQSGLKTCLIEKGKVGGTCLNVGCIPTKFLLTASKKYYEMLDFELFGLSVQDCTVDMDRMIAAKEDVVNKLVKGIQYLIKKNKIDFIEGKARLTGKNEVVIESSNNELVVQAENIIIATGTSPSLPKIFNYDGAFICSSNEALSWKDIPGRLAIIGGGVIGCEFATIFGSLGSRVTIIELMPGILANFDAELSRFATDKLKKLGVEIIAGTKVEGIGKSDSTVRVMLEGGSSIDADKVLVSIGRRADITQIGLEKVGVKIDDGSRKIAVDSNMRTNIENIYAVGDACNSPFDLAHVAMKEAIIAVENITGENKHMEYRCVPNCVFTNPEFASVGYTQEEVRNRNIDIKSGKFSFTANGKALTLGEAEGFVKVLIDANTDEIIGAQIVGPHATDLIAEVAVMIQNRSKGKQIAETIHAHPTLSEAVWEALESAYGRAVHS